MTDHTCSETDHASAVAARYGFFDWNTLWKPNEKKRTNPLILFAGDVLSIPAKKLATFSGLAVDTKHVFEVPRYKLLLRVRVFKADFTPIKDTDYELKVDGLAEPFTGQTKNGLVEHEIPLRAVDAELTVRVKAEDTDPPPPKTEGEGGEGAQPAGGDKKTAVRGDVPVHWDVKIGRLDPIQEKAPDDECTPGVQQRLNNVAMNAGAVNGEKTEKTKAAIQAFQELYKIEVAEPQKGKAEATTQKTLHDVHEGPNPPQPPKS